MRKFEKIFFMGLFLVSVLGYNNCGKVAFSPAQSLSSSSNTPAGLPPSGGGTLTFNDLNQPSTIAFNDNYPNAGDSDYNDFVTNINVTETYDNNQALNKIVIQYSPSYKISGSDHQFLLVFDGIVHGENGAVNSASLPQTLPMFNDSNGVAKIDYELVANGSTVSSDPNHNKDSDLIIFPSTTQALSQKQVATITITNLDPAQNSSSARGPLSILRYRGLLSVVNGSRYDIDISDINSSFLDGSGNPCGFFVPVNWRPPGEGQNINNIYPEFAQHALFLQGKSSLDQPTWFNVLAAGAQSLLAPLPQ